jgi:hypothetical protein
MFHAVLPTINSLFASEEQLRAPVKFSWRLVQRKRRPFLLLPDRAENIRFSLELYSAQRPLARLWRSFLPVLFKTPARALLGVVNAQAEASSAFLRFLAEQSGQPAEELVTPAIKFGGIAGRTSRVVLLLCDAAGNPLRVIKVGLNPEGRAATEREAAMLAKLPKSIIGCTTMTGRFETDTLSAFATAYFPGKSLANDVGIEKLFHAWLAPEASVPLENLPTWHEMESVLKKKDPAIWSRLRASLAGRNVTPTLFHGDFTPWNVRMTNLENIQAFDWERGHLEGIPAWDWFHFIIQTSILVKRHSPERVAAELDLLFQSRRFQEYARAAGISEIVEPLLLAYLLHEKHVVQPEDGGAVTQQLFYLLWEQWQLKNGGWPASGPARTDGLETRGSSAPRFQAQIKSAVSNLANLFWEPSLSPQFRPTFAACLKAHWKLTLATLVWFALVANLPLWTNPHLMFAPFYLVPVIVLAMRTDWRLATVMAQFGAIAGPLYFYHANPDFAPFRIICWNIVMRMLVFQVIVNLIERFGRHSVFNSGRESGARPNAIQSIAGNWPVIILTTSFFIVVGTIDVLTNPHILLMPLYMIPCITLTLALNWRWGLAAALIAAFLGPLFQRADAGYQPWEIQIWNTSMRLIIYLIVVAFLEQVRRKNILFAASRSK